MTDKQRKALKLLHDTFAGLDALRLISQRGYEPLVTAYSALARHLVDAVELDPSYLVDCCFCGITALAADAHIVQGNPDEQCCDACWDERLR